MCVRAMLCACTLHAALQQILLIVTCSEWKVPFLPVNPWQITLVSLLMNTLGACSKQITAMYF